MKKGIILKISGEALGGDSKNGIDLEKVDQIAHEIKALYDIGGIRLSIIVGAGNIWRGKKAIEQGMNRSSADYMGMLGTIINALALQNSLEALNLDTRVLTSISIPQVAEPYIRRKALADLDKDRIIIFGGGTGMPYFSTDTTAALRAAELNSDLILMAKNGVDGVYDKDPKTNKDAKKYSKLTHREVLEKNLQVMDATAASLCLEKNMYI